MDALPKGFYQKTTIGIGVIVPAKPDIYPREIKPATDLRKWITQDGGIHYYIKRNENYLQRYHWREKSPYYLEYGHKYMTKFNELKPKFSAMGQQWVTRTSHLLRQYMEDGLMQDSLQEEVWLYKEYNENKFLDFAYDTHPRAYTNGGICVLINNRLIDDLTLIWEALDKNDILNDRGKKQILDVLWRCIGDWLLDNENQKNTDIYKRMYTLADHIEKGI